MRKGRWIKPRKPIRKYAETEQQKKIREAGQKIREKCTGRKGSDFYNCRREILNIFFRKEK